MIAAEQIAKTRLSLEQLSQLNLITSGGGDRVQGKPLVVLELRNRKLPMPATPVGAVNQPPQPMPPVVCAGSIRQRDPAFFNGEGDQDAEDWLSSYERVSAHNKWDDAAKLHNVNFYLTHVAEVWYNNNARTFETWGDFKTRFSGAFGRPAVRKLRADQRLRGRAQTPGESFTSYIEDVVDLCRRVDEAMPEQDKVKHILKGIDDAAFQMLVAKDPKTVTEVVNLCQSFDELRRQRALVRHSLEPKDDLSSLTFSSEQSSLEMKIKDFVREEVARQLSIAPFVQQPRQSTEAPSLCLHPALQRTIREQVAEALPATRPPATAPAPLTVPQVATVAFPLTSQATVTGPLTYAQCVAQPAQPPAPSLEPTLPAPVPFNYQPVPQFARPVHVAAQQANPWRTRDNRPICFSCGFAGHVARYCRRVVPRAEVFNAPGHTPRQFQHPISSTPPPTSFAHDHQTFNSRQSVSPRRRSLSPMRRQPASSDVGN